MRRPERERHGFVRCLFLTFLVSLPAAAAVKLSSITISPGSVTGGGTATGTATLTTAAGHNGAVVTLSSSNTAAATVPASITIASGQTTGTFTINTSAVAAQTSVTITGNLGVNATASFTVAPPVLTSVSLDRTTLTALDSTQGTVTLDGPAPSAGIVVTLASTDACAQVPASVTITAGTTVAWFNVTTTQVTSTRNVTILASAGGNSRAVVLTVNPCYSQILSRPSVFPIPDVVWFDDALPAGMSLGSATWDTAYAVSGTQALTQPSSSSYHAMTLTGATTPLAVNPGESLIMYFLNSTCTPAREVILGWHTTAGAWKKAYLGDALLGGEANYVNLGTLSVAGAYRRIQVSAAALGVEGASIDGFSMELSDGQAWLDRGGKTCVMASAAAPVIPSTDVKWIDDGAEGGGTVLRYGSTVWDTSQHASGTQSLRMGDGTYGSWTNGGIGLDYAALPANVGDRLVIYLLGDTCAPPDALNVTITTTRNELVRVYWGSQNLTGYQNAVAAGAMPAPGAWARLEVPFHDLGIEERTVKSMVLSSHYGVMWIDSVSNSGTGCTMPTAAPPVVPSGDTLLLEDANTSGTIYNGSWSTAQHATGSASFTSPYLGSGDQFAGVEGEYPRLDISIGENIVFYVLFSPCLPPRQFKVSFSATGGISPIYWGTEKPSEGYYIGPMPTPGVWTRVEVPVRLLTQTQTQGLGGFFVWYTDGEYWIDHFGKSGTPCTTAVAARPTLPGTDTLWIHENQGGIYYGCAFETTQVAEGLVSFRVGSSQAGTLKGTFFGYQQELAYPVGSGDKLVAYVLLDECSPPDELMLQWRTGTLAENNLAYVGCYWGTPHVGGEGSLYVSMGPVPQPGVWTRLEIPASAVGLEGQTVTGIDVYAANGRTWWDLFGKTP